MQQLQSGFRGLLGRQPVPVPFWYATRPQVQEASNGLDHSFAEQLVASGIAAVPDCAGAFQLPSVRTRMEFEATILFGAGEQPFFVVVSWPRTLLTLHVCVVRPSRCRGVRFPVHGGHSKLRSSCRCPSHAAKWKPEPASVPRHRRAAGKDSDSESEMTVTPGPAISSCSLSSG